MRLIAPMFATGLLVCAGETGVPPRASVSDYQAHQNININSATLAAAKVPQQQIEKMFSTDVAKKYVVVEVGVYPQDGQAFNVTLLDFRLKIGATVAQVVDPSAIGTPWADQSGVPNKPVTVVTETGVVYSRTSDPVNGRRNELGTYESVTVTNDPGAIAPPPVPTQGPDPQTVEQRARDRLLPEGQTRTAVAGYLFFRQYNSKRRKSETMEFQWADGGASVVLRLPTK